MPSMTWQSLSGAVWSQRGPHPLAGQTILQIVPVLGADGTEQIIEIAEALASVGARPLVASAGGRLVPELQAKGDSGCRFRRRPKIRWQWRSTSESLPISFGASA